MAAKVLTEAGARVVMLEAACAGIRSRTRRCSRGRRSRPAAAASRPIARWRVHRGIGGWTIEGEPYTPGRRGTFDWFRCRMVGGRTNHWGRISLRYGPDDFNRARA
jgi:choline dehydrogenase-like flavoprotein